MMDIKEILLLWFIKNVGYKKKLISYMSNEKDMIIHLIVELIKKM